MRSVLKSGRQHGKPVGRGIVAGFATLALVLAACGADGDEEPVADEPDTESTSEDSGDNDDAPDGGDTADSGDQEVLEVGFIAALSGGGIGWGMSMLGGLELAFEEINEAGGLEVGDSTYQLEVIAYDSEYTGPGTAQAAQRLISQDGVDVIFGPLGSAGMLAMSEITEEAEVLVLSNSYTTKAISPDKPYTFRLTPTTYEFSGPMLEYIGNEFPELETAAILFPNDESGEEVRDHNIAGYEAAGIEVVATEAYERGTEDYTPIVSRALEAEPDILELNGTTPADSGAVIRQARQLGFEGQIIKTGGPGTPEIIEVAGEEDTEGYLYFSPWDPDAPEIRELTDRFQAAYDMQMDGLGLYFYEGGHMFANIMRELGTTDHHEIRDYLDSEAPDYEGLSGTFVWGGEEDYGIDHQWYAPFYVGQVQDGEEVMLTNIAS